MYIPKSGESNHVNSKDYFNNKLHSIQIITNKIANPVSAHFRNIDTPYIYFSALHTVFPGFTQAKEPNKERQFCLTTNVKSHLSKKTVLFSMVFMKI